MDWVIVYVLCKEMVWPLPTVETEVNGGGGGLKEYKMKGILSWLVPWTLPARTIDLCPALAALVSPIQNITFLTVHFFTLLVPVAQQPGQAGRVVDPHHLDADPDSTYHPDADPNSNLYLMRMRIRIFIGIGSGSDFSP